MATEQRQRTAFAPDYVTVNERLAAFTARYPEGSLQSTIVEFSASRVTVRAEAFRTPGDVRPGTGHSSLEIPGRTRYTRGSELENAETSAWGRALAALGFEVKRGIATQEEVASKRGAGQTVPTEAGPAAAEPQGAGAGPGLSRAEFVALVKEAELDRETVVAEARSMFPGRPTTGLTDEERRLLWDALTAEPLDDLPDMLDAEMESRLAGEPEMEGSA